MHLGMAFALRATASMAVNFMNQLYRRKEDRVWLDMMANCKAMTALQKLDYGALSGGGFKECLLHQFKHDTDVPAVEDAEQVAPEPEIDTDLLERDRKLQELMATRAVPRSKDRCG